MRWRDSPVAAARLLADPGAASAASSRERTGSSVTSAVPGSSITATSSI